MSIRGANARMGGARQEPVRALAERGGGSATSAGETRDKMMKRGSAGEFKIAGASQARRDSSENLVGATTAMVSGAAGSAQHEAAVVAIG